MVVRDRVNTPVCLCTPASLLMHPSSPRMHYVPYMPHTTTPCITTRQKTRRNTIARVNASPPSRRLDTPFPVPPPLYRIPLTPQVRSPLAVPTLQYKMDDTEPLVETTPDYLLLLSECPPKRRPHARLGRLATTCPQMQSSRPQEEEKSLSRGGLSSLTDSGHGNMAALPFGSLRNHPQCAEGGTNTQRAWPREAKSVSQAEAFTRIEISRAVMSRDSRASSCTCTSPTSPGLWLR